MTTSSFIPIPSTSPPNGGVPGGDDPWTGACSPFAGGILALVNMWIVIVLGVINMPASIIDAWKKNWGVPKGWELIARLVMFVVALCALASGCANLGYKHHCGFSIATTEFGQSVTSILTGFAKVVTESKKLFDLYHDWRAQRSRERDVEGGPEREPESESETVPEPEPEREPEPVPEPELAPAPAREPEAEGYAMVTLQSPAATVTSGSLRANPSDHSSLTQRQVTGSSG